MSVTCGTCDQSGWYVPSFSPTVLVNCAECNGDFSKEPVYPSTPAPRPAGDREP